MAYAISRRKEFGGRRLLRKLPTFEQFTEVVDLGVSEMKNGCVRMGSQLSLVSLSYGSPGLNGSTLPGGTVCSLIARIMAMVI